MTLSTIRTTTTTTTASTTTTDTAHQQTQLILYNRNSINAQKIVDERHGPHKPHDYISNSEMRLKPNFRPCPAISSYAGQAKGDNGSFAALRAYQNDFALRRDEILTDIARNGTD